LKTNNKINALTDDELLVQLVESHDIQYLGILFKRFIPKVYGTCLKYLSNAEQAQDAVMDIYQTVQAKFFDQDIQNFGAWLYVVSRNHCLQQLRKHKTENFVNFDEALMENMQFEHLLDTEVDDEKIEALNFCMQTLAIEQKQSIQLFYYDEKSYADIVELTGFALNKVKSYIQNAKRNLLLCVNKRLQETN
jgi:RNA polymerase sigma-70 factor, ECF subfamily